MDGWSKLEYDMHWANGNMVWLEMQVVHSLKLTFHRWNCVKKHTLKYPFRYPTIGFGYRVGSIFIKIKIGIHCDQVEYL